MSEVVLVAKSLGSLALVIVLVLVLGKLAGKRMGNGALSKRRGQTGAVAIESRLSLAKSQSLVSVRYGDRRLLLGVTSSSVSVLRDDEIVEAEPAVNGIESIDLRSSEHPEDELLSQWGLRRSPTQSTVPAASWMALLGNFKGSRPRS